MTESGLSRAAEGNGPEQEGRRKLSEEENVTEEGAQRKQSEEGNGSEEEARRKLSEEENVTEEGAQQKVSEEVSWGAGRRLWEGAEKETEIWLEQPPHQLHQSTYVRLSHWREIQTQWRWRGQKMPS
jgi:hypothetical protein